MKDEGTVQPASKGGGVLGILGWVTLALMVYVLSVGPVARYCKNKGSPPSAVIAFYAPLGYLARASPPVQKFFKWYGEIWGVRL